MTHARQARTAVSLVGCGPGDPELLTVRAVKRIEAADVLLCDALVDPRVLALARPEARVLQVGKRGFKPSTDQRFIHELMIREARRGLRVVRLKGGDPFVFGRGGEEADALRAAGIEVEVVSGLTAGLAGPAALGLPVTDRRCTPGVALVTGHNGEGGRSPDWAALARSGLTLVVYMGVTHVAAIAQALLAAGMRADLPAAVVCAAHTAAQRECLCTLATLSDTVQREQVAAPALLVIGEVVGLAPGWRSAVALARPPTPAAGGER